MDSEQIASYIASMTQFKSDFKEAVNLAYSIIEGLEVFEPINRVAVFEHLKIIDRRFGEKRVIDKIFVPTDKINGNGTIYLGKNKAEDFIKNKDTLLIFVCRKD